ncbi:MAG: SRPBCC domain-containing protein [Chloroflexota bacterium]
MDDPVFAALADPTRRLLLDRLFERDGRTLGDLVSAVPGMTRFGVMKHIRVLEAASLVTTRKVGRETHHYLNPVPIRRLHDRWLDKYRMRAADVLLDLQRSAETIEDTLMTTTLAPAFVQAIFIKASPETVWRALTESDMTVRYYYRSRIDSDWQPGSPYVMTLDGVPQIEGVIVEADKPSRLVQTFHAVWDEKVAADAPSRVTWELTPAGPGITKVTVVHEELVTGSETETSVSRGWPYLLSGLKSVLETGESLGPLGA